VPDHPASDVYAILGELIGRKGGEAGDIGTSMIAVNWLDSHHSGLLLVKNRGNDKPLDIIYYDQHNRTHGISFMKNSKDTSEAGIQRYTNAWAGFHTKKQWNDMLDQSAVFGKSQLELTRIYPEASAPGGQ
jgi:hypothetical protein